jgi:hypothetical protein
MSAANESAPAPSAPAAPVKKSRGRPRLDGTPAQARSAEGYTLPPSIVALQNGERPYAYKLKRKRKAGPGRPRKDGAPSGTGRRLGRPRKDGLPSQPRAPIYHPPELIVRSSTRGAGRRAGAAARAAPLRPLSVLRHCACAGRPAPTVSGAPGVHRVFEEVLRHADESAAALLRDANKARARPAPPEEERRRRRRGRGREGGRRAPSGGVRRGRRRRGR